MNRTRLLHVEFACCGNANKKREEVEVGRDGGRCAVDSSASAKKEKEEAKVSSQVTALQLVFTKSGLISSHSIRSPTRSTNTHTQADKESRQSGRARPLHRFTTTVTLPHSMTRCENVCVCLCVCVFLIT